MADSSAKVVEWVNKQEKQSKSVGAGECWDLAEQALKEAGAKTSRDLTPDLNENSDYIWGRQVRTSDVKPGDIIQFRNYHWTRKTRTDIEGSDGSSSWSEKSQSQDRPHHTAVVVAVNGDGSVKVVEQNVEGRRFAHSATLVLESGKKPAQTEEKKKGNKTEKKQTSVEDEVTGTVWIYRPIGKEQDGK